jgi:hypothetical protein
MPSRQTLKSFALTTLASASGNALPEIGKIQMAVSYPRALATPQVIFYSTDVLIALLVPNWSYADALQEAMRKREPPESVAVPDVFKVAVSPSTIRSPDIMKIIVERDGKVVPPVANNLAPTELTTAVGAKFIVHRGAVSYPCAAFLPGGVVKVTAIPDNGSNIEHTFSEHDLSDMSGLTGNLK